MAVSAAETEHISDGRADLAPAGQLVAPWAPAQLGLDGRAYALPSASGQAAASGGAGAEPPLRAEGPNPYLGPCTRFPAAPPHPPGGVAVQTPDQLDLPIGRWLRHDAQLDLFDARPDHRHPQLGPYVGDWAVGDYRFSLCRVCLRSQR